MKQLLKKKVEKTHNRFSASSNAIEETPATAEWMLKGMV